MRKGLRNMIPRVKQVRKGRSGTASHRLVCAKFRSAQASQPSTSMGGLRCQMHSDFSSSLNSQDFHYCTDLNVSGEARSVGEIMASAYRLSSVIMIHLGAKTGLSKVQGANAKPRWCHSIPVSCFLFPRVKLEN